MLSIGFRARIMHMLLWYETGWGTRESLGRDTQQLSPDSLTSFRPSISNWVVEAHIIMIYDMKLKMAPWYIIHTEDH